MEIKEGPKHMSSIQPGIDDKIFNGFMSNKDPEVVLFL